ncbi:MAG: hypothetical protein IKS32_06185 [Solobacterium sp.]|nr:hypothetical protein [Solobacterium sp.]
MNNEMKKKILADNELEPVSGGLRRETDELVALYNEYNPDRTVKMYCPAVLEWVFQVWDCDYYSRTNPNRPVVHNREGLNTYELPGYGTVEQRKFMKLTAERAAAKAIQNGQIPLE